MCTSGAHRSYERVVEPVELELQMVVRYDVGAGN